MNFFDTRNVISTFIFALILLLTGCSSENAPYELQAIALEEQFGPEECTIKAGITIRDGDTFQVVQIGLVNVDQGLASFPIWRNSSAAALRFYSESKAIDLSAFDGVDVTVTDKSGVDLANYSSGESLAYTIAALRQADSLRILFETILTNQSANGGLIGFRGDFDSTITDADLDRLDSIFFVQRDKGGRVISTQVLGFRYVKIEGLEDSFTEMEIGEQRSDHWDTYRFTYNDRTRKIVGVQLDPEM